MVLGQQYVNGAGGQSGAPERGKPLTTLADVLYRVATLAVVMFCLVSLL